jgi:hypothetical protein
MNVVTVRQFYSLEILPLLTRPAAADTAWLPEPGLGFVDNPPERE